MVTTRQPPKRIFLVEDNFLIQESLSTILATAGYMVAVAPNGQEAINRLRTSMRPDLILLDLRMPVMDGWQFRQELKRDEQLRSIPVVIVSGMDEGGAQLLTLEAAGFLHKPIDTTELLRMLRQCCG
jgi:CheY-like chemotaxis protein